MACDVSRRFSTASLLPVIWFDCRSLGARGASAQRRTVKRDVSHPRLIGALRPHEITRHGSEQAEPLCHVVDDKWLRK